MSSGGHSYRKRNRTWRWAAALSVLAMVGLAFYLRHQTAIPAAKKSNLVVYCAAGIRKPVEEAARQYEKEFGVEIRLDYGSSGELESRLALEKQNHVARCDLYIPADRFFARRAQGRGLTRESIPLGRFHLVLAVSPGSALDVSSVGALLRSGVPFAMCDEQAGAGKKTRDVLSPLGVYDAVKNAKKSSFPRVTEAASAVKSSDAVTAAFIWDSTARQFGLEAFELPELTGSAATISANVTAASRKVPAALHFARYLAAPEKGQPAFKKYYYENVPGDPWADVPEIVAYCGGVNREALKQTLKDFEKREGCVVKTFFAGCGTIVGSIKAGKLNLPDTFMTCDASYMDMVADDFLDATTVSSTQVVMLVRKGNPKGIRTLGDLTRSGVTIGTTDRRMSTLGTLSWLMFEQAGIKDDLERNRSVIVTTPTAHELILQMEGHGKLDVALVYQANCQNLSDRFDWIPIDLPRAKAVQNIAVCKRSHYPQLASRLLHAILSSSSRERFVSSGFHWEAGSKEP